jgi:hypothetical protein
VCVYVAGVCARGVCGVCCCLCGAIVRGWRRRRSASLPFPALPCPFLRFPALSCRGLLRTTHQRAGLELMDQMSAHQEAAYEHLCR